MDDAEIGAETKGETRKSLIQLILKKGVVIRGDRVGMIRSFTTSRPVSRIMVTRGKISVDEFGVL
jgi:hypothetical protein